MIHLTAKKFFVLINLFALLAIINPDKANAQWSVDNINDETTTYDRVRVISPDSDALDNYAGAKLFIQNSSVSANNALRVWQQRENHSAVQIGTNGYGLKISSTTATPNSRWLMHMDHNGDHIFTVKADGRVGIGQAFPSGKFQIDHNGSTLFSVLENGRVGVGTTGPGGKIGIVNANNTNVPALYINQQETGNSACNLTTSGYGLYVKSVIPNSNKYLLRLLNSNNQNVIYARADGRVGIGTSSVPSGYKLNVAGKATISELGVATSSIPSGYKMAVDGKMIAEEVKVRLSQNWPDYVFTPEHQRPSLEELEANIEQLGHLPNMPSAQEVEAEGYLLGEMDVKLLEKIEELTLYLIDLNKTVNELKAENTELKEQFQTNGK